MERLLYGAAYYEEYLPVDRLEKDVEMMKAAGINVVRIAESTWSTCEPQDGVFDFSHVERVLDAMEQAGISVIIGTPTYAVPTWMVKAYPEVLATTKQGQGIYGARQIMDITNPVSLVYAERVIRKLMEHTAHRSCAIGFQLDNETKYYGTAGKNVQQGFVKYLREKFQDDLDAMLEYNLMSSRLCRQEGDFRQALAYHEQYSLYVDSLTHRRENERVMQWQKKYDYSLVRNENMRLKTESQQKDIVTLVCIIILLLLVPFLYAVYLRFKRRKESFLRRQHQLMEANIQSLQAKDSELLRIRQELASKERKWRESVFLSDPLVKHIDTFVQLSLLDKDRLSSSYKLSGADWDHLISLLNSCHNNYVSRLQSEFPGLKEIEISICCLLRMHIKNRDICYLLGISDDALKKRKYRIKTDKLHLRDAEISLEDFLCSY